MDMVDYFQSGQSRVQVVFDADTTLQKMWEGRRKQVVLILIDIEYEEDDREQVQQTGFLMNEGQLVLTVSHGFLVEDGIIRSIRSVDYWGQIQTLQLTHFQYDDEREPAIDWAILIPNRPIAYVPYVHPIKATPSDNHLIIGYPGGMGVNESGQVIRIGEHSQAKNSALAFICKVSNLDAHMLLPLAGTIPVNGISGSPVFGGDGELVGLFSSMSRSRYLTGWQTIFHMVEVPVATIDSLSPK